MGKGNGETGRGAASQQEAGKGGKGWRGSFRTGVDKAWSGIRQMSMTLKIGVALVLGIIIVAVASKLMMHRPYFDKRLLLQARELLKVAQEQYQLAHQDYNALVAFQHNAAAGAALHVLRQLFGDEQANEALKVNLHEFEQKVRQQAREIREVLGKKKDPAPHRDSPALKVDLASSPPKDGNPGARPTT